MFLTAIIVLTLLFPRDVAEDLRTVRDFWLQNQQPSDATYVYYGAIPGFEYQLDLMRTQGRCPPSWGAACMPTNVYFGGWIRGRDPQEMAFNVQQTIGDWPERLWLIFSHVIEPEDAQLIEALTPLYRVHVQQIAQGASVVMLIRQGTPEQ